VAGFEAATAVRQTAPGNYTAEIDPQWRIGKRPHGGYLLAMMGRAAAHEAGQDHPHPTAVSAHYLAPPTVAPAEIAVTTLRRGRTVVQQQVTLTVDGTLCVAALITCGRLPQTQTPWWTGVAPITLPPEDECVLMVRADGTGPRIASSLHEVVSQRIDPACLSAVDGEPAGLGEMRGWLRLYDGQEPDPFVLLLAIDCMPPASYDLGVPPSWVPTLELTGYVLAVPAPGPLRVRLKARLVADGRMDEECDVVDSTGALVATARQLAGVRLPEGSPSPWLRPAVATAID
jgi:Thioesterase-like superfamily